MWIMHKFLCVSPDDMTSERFYTTASIIIIIMRI